MEEDREAEGHLPPKKKGKERGNEKDRGVRREQRCFLEKGEGDRLSRKREGESEA